MSYWLQFLKSCIFGVNICFLFNMLESYCSRQKDTFRKNTTHRIINWITPGSLSMLQTLKFAVTKCVCSVLGKGQKGAFQVLVVVGHLADFWIYLNFWQDECVLEPELYERAEKLFRILLLYVTDFLVWEESSNLPDELQPRYDLFDHTSKFKTLNLTLTVYFFIHADKKNLHTSVYCTMMSITRTTMWSTPCSVLLTVIKLKHRHTQHLLTRRYRLLSFTLLLKGLF